MVHSETWNALAREAGLAAEHLAIGVTALGRANYAQQAYYSQAFFALSIGLERSAKLALIVDHALDNGGAFPDSNTIRKYGHNLRDLMLAIDTVARQRGMPAGERLPRSVIHDAIIDVLSDFASNITRYYNIDLLTAAPKVAAESPWAAWHKSVLQPVLAKHYTPRQRARDEKNARIVDQMMGAVSLVIHASEDGTPIRDAYNGAMETSKAERAAPFVRMYTLQIARFVSHIMFELGYAAQVAQLEDVPYLPEFYAIFNNDDKYLRSRKTWSTYRP